MWLSSNNVYVYQIIMLYNLNVYNFLFVSYTSIRRGDKKRMALWASTHLRTFFHLRMAPG